jgi:tetratricopeptide (TPR) repeat protein
MRAVRVRFLTLAVAGGALAMAHAAHAQLPDEVRAAGITAAQWTVVHVQVQRYAADKHVSERALSAVCAKMGIELVRGRHFDLDQMISLISGQADKLNALTESLTLQTQQGNPAAAGLLKQAQDAIDAGDLDHAELLLDQATTAAATAVESGQRQQAKITATKGQLKAIEFDYLAAAADYAQAASQLPANDAHDRWSYVIHQGEMLKERGTLFEEPQPLQAAIALYRDTALPLAPREADPRDWAATENHLGIALRTVGSRGDLAATHDAIAAFRAAAEASTRVGDSDESAIAQNNLGNALLTVGKLGDKGALHDAVAAYRTALEVWTRERDPALWAQIQDNLGVALDQIGEQEGSVPLLHDAIATDRAALEVQTRSGDPTHWARTQINLGDALEALGERGDDKALHDAIAAYQQALEVLNRDNDPSEWAMAEIDLGVALEKLGELGQDQALFEAIAAYRAALEVVTRDRDAVSWAGTTSDLGEALERLGERGHVQALHDAVAAERSALEVFTAQAYPLYAKAASDIVVRADAALAKLKQ